MKNIFFFIIISLVLLSSCEVPITLDLKQTPSKIVIEGLVTDKPGKQYVKVSRSNSFYDNGTIPTVTDAQVMVKDDLGNEFPFDAASDSAGYYFPQQNDFAGEIGRTYYLTVTVDNTTYTAEDKLLSVFAIDSLKYRVNSDEKEKPKTENKFYELQMFAKEPQATKDYYFFKFYRNDSLKFDNNSDVYAYDDEALSENIDGIVLPLYYGIGDTARVEIYSLSRTGFTFYSDLMNLINNDGGIFNAPPANCRNNLSNGALGFFQVSAMNEKQVVIKE